MPILVAPAPPPVFSQFPAEPTRISFGRDLGTAGPPVELSAWSDFADGIASSGRVIQPGVLGLLMPSWEFFADRSPAFDGETIRGVRAQPRDVTVPIYLFGRDRTECLDQFAQLIYELNPQHGLGVLTVTEPGGTSRSIECYYKEGLEGVDDDDASGRTWMRAALVFHAPRPFWEGDPLTVSWALSQAAGTFLPILPLRVNESAVLGAVIARNLGNAIAFPQWTITGPASSPIVITNSTTGESFTIAQSLAAGDTAVIDAREGQKTAVSTGTSGTRNLWEWMDITTSELWGLTPGDNQVSLSIPGATSATRVTMLYKPRYLAAYG